MGLTFVIQFMDINMLTEKQPKMRSGKVQGNQEYIHYLITMEHRRLCYFVLHCLTLVDFCSSL